MFTEAPCIIPWIQNFTYNYFCDSSFKCKTSENSLNYCQTGNFLFGRTDLLGNPFSAQLKIPNINLPYSGEYDLNFFILMYCNGKDCSNANDTLFVGIETQSDNPSGITFKVTSIEQRKVWLRKTIRFLSTKPNININVNFFFKSCLIIFYLLFYLKKLDGCKV